MSTESTQERYERLLGTNDTPNDSGNWIATNTEIAAHNLYCANIREILAVFGEAKLENGSCSIHVRLDDVTIVICAFNWRISKYNGDERVFNGPIVPTRGEVVRRLNRLVAKYTSAEGICSADELMEVFVE